MSAAGRAAGSSPAAVLAVSSSVKSRAAAGAGLQGGGALVGGVARITCSISDAACEEHVLGAAQPMPSARGSGPSRVLTGVGVRPDPQPAPLVGVPQQQIDGLYQVGGLLVGALGRGVQPVCM